MGRKNPSLKGKQENVCGASRWSAEHYRLSLYKKVVSLEAATTAGQASGPEQIPRGGYPYRARNDGATYFDSEFLLRISAAGD